MSDLAITNQDTQVSTINFTQDQVELVKRTVAKGSTDDELKMFLYLSQRYNLDPFAKEIWFIKYGGTPTIMTSRDGYLKIAQNNADYEGLISFAVCEGDEFAIDAANYSVSHKFGAKRGKIIGAWARCDRKGRNPQICFVPFAEYAGTSNIWKQYPSAMIQKVAEVFVLKRQFTISGLVTTEELSANEAANNNTYQNSKPTTITQAQQRKIFAISKELGIDKETIQQMMLDKFNKKSTSELTTAEMNTLIDLMQSTIEKQESTVIEAEIVEQPEFDLSAIEITDEDIPE